MPLTPTPTVPRDRRPARRRRRSLAVAALTSAVAVTLALTGCTAKDSLADQAQAGDDKNYIAGDGSVTEYAPEQRGDPVKFTGTDFDGKKISAESLHGQVTVLNFWYAACAPCRSEAPGLEELNENFADDGVQFYGVNVRDEKGTAEAFERSFNITYPSFNDKDGSVVLGMSDYVPPSAVPTTIVLDQNGKVAARVLGMADSSTLKALIDDALGKAAPSATTPAALPAPATGAAASRVL